MSEVCRNCLYSNRGAVKHNFTTCKSLGNRCVLTCPKCKGAGRIKDDKHWAADCPYSR